MKAHIIKLFPPRDRGMTTLVFLHANVVIKFFSGSVKYLGAKFAIFDRNRYLPQKQYEIGPWL